MHLRFYGSTQHVQWVFFMSSAKVIVFKKQMGLYWSMYKCKKDNLSA